MRPYPPKPVLCGSTAAACGGLAHAGSACSCCSKQAHGGQHVFRNAPLCSSMYPVWRDAALRPLKSKSPCCTLQGVQRAARVANQAALQQPAGVWCTTHACRLMQHPQGSQQGSKQAHCSWPPGLTSQLGAAILAGRGAAAAVTTVVGGLFRRRCWGRAAASLAPCIAPGSTGEA